MRIQHATALLGVTVLAAACGRGSSASLDTDSEKASYAVGLEIGSSLRQAAGHLDVDAFARGVDDILAGRDPAIDQMELQEALQRFSQQIQESIDREQSEVSERNRQEGEAYLAQNAERDGVQTTASGLQYEVLEEGTGARPRPSDQVRVHYRGTLVDGTEFDSSYERGEPATFGLQPGGLIAGFSEGVLLMPEGSKYRFVIPSDLAYGPQGTAGAIGPDATLIFEVELLEIL